MKGVASNLMSPTATGCDKEMIPLPEGQAIITEDRNGHEWSQMVTNARHFYFRIFTCFSNVFFGGHCAQEAGEDGKALPPFLSGRLDVRCSEYFKVQ